MARERVEVVVVGAGVVGLAVARALARQGREVLVLEAERAAGTGVTARNSEVIHAGFHYPPGSLKARLCLAGRELLYAFCAERGIAHRRTGKLVVATEAAQRPRLEQLAIQGEQAGVRDLSLLSGSDARALEPALRCDSALLSPSTGIIDAHGLVHAIRADATRGGAVIALATPLVAGTAGSSGIEIEVGPARDPLSCGALVNAAGLSACDVAAMLGGVPRALVPRLHPVKGSYFALRGRAPFSRLIYPVPEPGGLGIHLTLDLAGGARFGPDVEPVDAIDYSVDPDGAERFAASVRRFWPALPEDALLPGFAGVRPRITPPGAPLADFQILGPAAHGIPGLVHLFGIESPGLTAALALGDHVASVLA